MAEAIQAPNPVSFPQSRPQRRDRETDTGFKFAHWLASEAEANDAVSGDVPFPVPLMSAEGILILAQAEEEEFALAARAYQKMAAQFPGDDGQYSFEFMALEHTLSEDL